VSRYTAFLLEDWRLSRESIRISRFLPWNCRQVHARGPADNGCYVRYVIVRKTPAISLRAMLKNLLMRWRGFLDLACPWGLLELCLTVGLSTFFLLPISWRLERAAGGGCSCPYSAVASSLELPGSCCTASSRSSSSVCSPHLECPKYSDEPALRRLKQQNKRYSQQKKRSKTPRVCFGSERACRCGLLSLFCLASFSRFFLLRRCPRDLRGMLLEWLLDSMNSLK
jgi:hypothetical protein